MTRFESAVCLVTGASRGIGRGVALGLARFGAKIYITGRTLKPTGGKVGGSLQETAAEIEERGGKAHIAVVDHTDEKQILELFDRIEREQKGRLDILVNCAYSAIPFLFETTGKVYYEIDSCTPGEAWDKINNVGLRSYYICCHLATRMMMRYREADPNAPTSLIVNVSSTGGQHYSVNPIYGCGKAALERMTSDMAHELKMRNVSGISILILYPGYARTEQVMSAVETRSSRFTDYYANPRFSHSTELCGLAVAALFQEDKKTLLLRSGDIVWVSDLCQQYSIKDLDGSDPPNYRSLKLLLEMSNSRFAGLIPQWITLPKFLFMRLVRSK